MTKKNTALCLLEQWIVELDYIGLWQNWKGCLKSYQDDILISLHFSDETGYVWSWHREN